MKNGLPFKYKVYEKKNKLYVVADYVDKATGKHKRKWLPTGLDAGTKKKEVTAVADKVAMDFFAKYLTDETNAVPNSVEESTGDKTQKENVAGSAKDYEFSEFMYAWLETMKSRVSINTLKGYKSKVKRMEAYFKDKNIKLKNLKPIDIQEFYNCLYNEGHTGNNIKHYHANIHLALKYAVKADLIPTNPADKVDLPKIKKYEATFYSKEELEKLFEAFKGDRMELVVYIAAFYGLRRSEIIGLKWDAIDFNRKTIAVRSKVLSIYDGGKENVVCETELKTEASRRTLPLIPYIEALLLKQKTEIETYSRTLKSGYDHTYDEFVCVDKFGKLITPNFVSTHFNYIIKKSGLKPLRFHDLRHSCASLLLANGIGMKSIQDWLGHSTFNVTANFYSHLDYNSRVESADVISKILGGEQSNEKDKTK